MPPRDEEVRDEVTVVGKTSVLGAIIGETLAVTESAEAEGETGVGRLREQSEDAKVPPAYAELNRTPTRVAALSFYWSALSASKPPSQKSSWAASVRCRTASQ